MNKDIKDFFDIFGECLVENEYRRYVTALGAKSKEGLFSAMEDYFDRRSKNQDKGIR